MSPAGHANPFASAASCTMTDAILQYSSACAASWAVPGKQITSRRHSHLSLQSNQDSVQ